MRFLQRNKKTMVRDMCGVKLVNRMKVNEPTQMVGIGKYASKPAMAYDAYWLSDVVKKSKKNALIIARIHDIYKTYWMNYICKE